jgi:pimeloyl-ACP methyl ester carboxylesterase
MGYLDAELGAAHGVPEDQHVGHLASLPLRKRSTDRLHAVTRERLAEPLRPVPHVVDWIYSIALQTPLDVVLKTVRAQSRLDHRAVLERLEIPVLAVYCRHDPYYPTELATYIAETAPDGQALVLEESAHFPFLEADTDRFNEAIAAFASQAPQ